MRAFSASRFALELPPGHRYPSGKGSRVRARVIERGLLSADAIVDPEPAPRDALLLAHDAAWVDAVLDGSVPPRALRRLGLPWNPALRERALRATWATVCAARDALDGGVGLHLGGGSHHAFADRGEGFCVWNDLAVAIRLFQRAGRIARAAVVDLDVHQGNGTASIFDGDEQVYTFSMHGARNYPFTKERSRRDVELPDGTTDDDYLAALDRELPRVLEEAAADLVLYVAGVDPHADDRFGRLALTDAGLRERDRRVIAACRARAIPLAVTLAGGYGRDPERTAELHVNTVEELVRAHR